MRHFVEHSAKIAVPNGACVLDESTLRSKGRCRGVTYLPSKPDKYGIRFYTVCGKKYIYLFTFFDNGSGNKVPPVVVRYTDIFGDLRRPIKDVCEKNIPYNYNNGKNNIYIEISITIKNNIY